MLAGRPGAVSSSPAGLAVGRYRSYLHPAGGDVGPLASPLVVPLASPLVVPLVAPLVVPAGRLLVRVLVVCWSECWSDDPAAASG